MYLKSKWAWKEITYTADQPMASWGSEKQGTKSIQKQEDDLNKETSFFPLAQWLKWFRMAYFKDWY